MVFSIDFGDTTPEFARKRFCQGGFQYPSDVFHTVAYISRHTVEIVESFQYRLEPLDDCILRFHQKFRVVDNPALFTKAIPVAFYHIRWHQQRDIAVGSSRLGWDTVPHTDVEFVFGSRYRDFVS